MNTETKDYKSLGWQNAWVETPKEVKECKHKREVVDENRSLTITKCTCHECKIYWYVDSSD